MTRVWKIVFAVAAWSFMVVMVSAQEKNQNPKNNQQNQENKQNLQNNQQSQDEDLTEARKNDVTHFLNRFDANKDKAIQKEELPKRLHEGFAKIDKNSDNKLDQEELQEHALQMHAMCDQCQTGFILIYRAQQDPTSLSDLQNAYELLRAMDEDNDGKLTQEELKARMEMVRQKHAQGIIQEWDRDADQKLSKEEAGGFLRDRFNQIDSNQDNSLTAEELSQSFVPQQLEQTSTKKNQPQKNQQDRQNPDQ